MTKAESRVGGILALHRVQLEKQIGNLEQRGTLEAADVIACLGP